MVTWFIKALRLEISTVISQNTWLGFYSHTEKNSWSNFTQLPTKFGTYRQLRSYLVSL